MKQMRMSFDKEDGHLDNIHLNSPFSMEELTTQLAQCKETAPGPDDITVSMIKNLPPEALCKLLDAFNQIWTSREYPDIWRKEIKLPFLKPGKDAHLPESYRPITLTSCVGKLMERMINHRLVWFLEKNNILCPQQSGFRKHKSTMDALSQLTAYIEESFLEKTHNSSVL